MKKLNITSVLAKIETTSNVDAVPTGAANSILLAGQPTLTPMELREEDRELIRPYLGQYEKLMGSITCRLDLPVEIAGAGTAGTAPPWGPLMRGCGTSETLSAVAVTGTGQVGGGTNGIKLAAAASAVNDIYVGLPIAITGGTGSGQSGIIVDYDGTTKIATVAAATWVATDATSLYSIAPGAVYRPISTSEESLSLYAYLDGVLHKFIGSKGNCKTTEEVNKRPLFNFSYTGIFAPVTDAAMPTNVFTGFQKPLLCNKANTPFFGLLGAYGIGLEKFEFDTGNTIDFLDFINLADSLALTQRASSGTFSLESVAIAIKDWYSTISGQVNGNFALTHGTTAGNRVTISAPNVSLASPGYGTKQNVRTTQLEARFNPLAGNDEWAIAAH